MCKLKITFLYERHVMILLWCRGICTMRLLLFHWCLENLEGSKMLIEVLECILNWICGYWIYICGLAGFEFPDCVCVKNFGYVEYWGWYSYRGNAAEISVANCFLKVLTLSMLMRVLVKMTKSQILTRLWREFGVAKGAERGM